MSLLSLLCQVFTQLSPIGPVLLPFSVLMLPVGTTAVLLLSAWLTAKRQGFGHRIIRTDGFRGSDGGCRGRGRRAAGKLPRYHGEYGSAGAVAPWQASTPNRLTPTAVTYLVLEPTLTINTVVWHHFIL